MSVSAVTSNARWFSFLSQRTTGSKVLAGGCAVSLAANTFLPHEGESDSFISEALKIADNIASIAGIASIFPPFAVLTLPVAAYFGIRGLMEICSGKFLSGALKLLGALPIFGLLKGGNFLNFKGMVKGPVDETVAKALKIENLNNPAEALKTMGKNISRLEKEMEGAQKALTQAQKGVTEAKKAAQKTIDELVKKGVAKPADLAGKSLLEQSQIVTKNLKELIKEQQQIVDGFKKSLEKIREAGKKAQEKFQEALKSATTEAEKKALKIAFDAKEAIRKAHIDRITKELADPSKKLAELLGQQKVLDQSLKALGKAQANAAYAQKIVDAHQGILNDAVSIKQRLENYIQYTPMSANNPTATHLANSILKDYNSLALQTIRTDYLTVTEHVIGQSYGPIAQSQFKWFTDFFRNIREKGFNTASREAIKSARTGWRDLWISTAPDPLPVNPSSIPASLASA